MNKKRWVLFSLFFGALLLVVSWQPLSVKVSRLVFKYVSETSLGERIDFESIAFHRGRVVLKKPKLGRQRSVAKKGGLYLEARESVVFYSFSWLNKSLDLQIDLEEPTAYIYQSDTAIEEIKKLFNGNIEWIDLKVGFRAKNGNLNLVDAQGEQNIHFNFETRVVGDGQSIAHLSLFKDASYLKGFLHQKDQNYDLKLDLDQVDLGAFAKAIGFSSKLYHKKSFRLDELDGVLNGSFECFFSPKQYPLARLRLDGQRVTFKGLDSKLEGNIPKISIHCESLNRTDEPKLNTLNETLGYLLKNSVGSIHLPLKSSVFDPHGCWRVEDLNGKLSLQGQSPSVLNLKGSIHTVEEDARFDIDGLGYLFNPRGELKVGLKKKGLKDAKAKLTLTPLVDQNYRLFTELENFSKGELEGIKKLLKSKIAKIDEIDLKSGLIDTRVYATLQRGKIMDLNVDHFVLEDVSVGPIGYIREIQNISANGSLTFDFKQEDPVKMASGDVSFQASVLDMGGWPLSDVAAESAFGGGEIQFAKFKGRLGDIEGVGQWNHVLKGKPLKLTLRGTGKDFLPYTPNSIREIYEPLMKEAPVEISLLGDYQSERVNLAIECKLDQQKVDLGLSLAKRENRGSNSRELTVFSKSFIKPLSIFPSKMALPLDGSPSSPFKIESGWLKAKEVDAEQYLRPLLFSNTTIVFTGKTDVEGTFDERSLIFSYSGYDLKLDHNDVQLKVKDTGTPATVGTHYFNFSDQNHFGELLIRGGECFLKECDLVFENVEGPLKLTSNAVFSDSLKTTCQNLPLEGKFSICFLEEGFDLVVQKPKLRGDFKSFASFFKAFGMDTLEGIPLTALVKINPQAGSFVLKKRGEYSHTLDVLGEVKHGEFTHLPLKGLSFGFHYNSEINCLKLSNMKGRWWAQGDTSYLLENQYLDLNFDSAMAAPFDLRIKDLYRDRARLKGQLFLSSNPKQPYKIILEDEKNHFGALSLNQLTLRMRADYTPQFLHLDFTTNFENLLKDPLFSSAISSKFDVSTLNPLGLKGDLTGQWIFDLNEENHKFYAWGDQVSSIYCPSGTLEIRGHRLRGMNYLDELSYQNCKASFKIEEKPLSYFIHDFRLQGPHAFYLDLSGTYCKIFKSFSTHIHKLYASLDRMALLQESAPVDLSGQIDLKGELKGGFFNKDWSLDLNLKGKSSQLKISDLSFSDDLISMSLHLKDKSLWFSKFDATLKSLYNYPIELAFQAGGIHLGKSFADSSVETVSFQLPSEHLRDFRSCIEDKLDVSWPSLLTLKEEDCLKGEFSYEPKKAPYSLSLALSDGLYSYNQIAYPLSQIKLFYGEGGLECQASFSYQGFPYWLQLKKEECTKESLYCTLASEPFTEGKSSKGLTLKCDIREKQPFTLKSIHGLIGGMRVDLVHRAEKDKEDKLAYLGQVQVVDKEFFRRLPKDLSDTFEKMKLGEGYFLSGQFMLGAQNLQDYSFEGLLGGQNFDLLGYEFKSLSSSITMDAHSIKVKDLKISDLCGALYIPELKLLTKGDNYQLSIPKTELKNFKPSLLHKRGEGPLQHKPLIIESFEVLNLGGDLSSPKSIVGTGTLSFLKSPKKQSTLLDIPAHLLSKLGLDLTMLNPVEGKVQFDIKDERINFTRLIDVYSHDKRCHFQLAKSPTGSYLDFDGNLSVRIKMKQYVLLKITEPFLISVQGNYSNPRFSLMRKKIKVDVPQRTPAQ